MGLHTWVVSLPGGRFSRQLVPRRHFMHGKKPADENLPCLHLFELPGEMILEVMKRMEVAIGERKRAIEIELGVDLTVENGEITSRKRNHATFEHIALEDDEEANRMAWAQIARTPNRLWQVIDPRYAHVPDPDQTLTIQEETHRCHEKMDRIYNTGPSTSSS